MAPSTAWQAMVWRRLAPDAVSYSLCCDWRSAYALLQACPECGASQREPLKVPSFGFSKVGFPKERERERGRQGPKKEAAPMASGARAVH